MIVDKSLPKFDLPVEFMAGDEFFGDILTYYSKFPCKIKSFLFVLCKEGSIRGTINQHVYTIRAGDLVTLIPGTFIQIHELDKNIRLIFAGFSSGFIEGNVQITQLDLHPVIWEHPVLHLTDETTCFYNDFFTLLINGGRTEDITFNPDALKGILQFTLAQISAAYKKQFHTEAYKLNRSNEILTKFLRLLHEHYHKEHSVSFYADKVGITFQHFCKTIKQSTGKTPSEIINNILIMDAKSYLKSTSFSVKEIAVALGFQNTSFFSKFFKHHTAMTPQEYRGK
ncbi:MAG: AraC family transcriptional regulator [Tannerellaceae bacterium]|nr:AraC family transcriptional regulator [Tannerellaceae bacterium]